MGVASTAEQLGGPVKDITNGAKGLIGCVSITRLADCVEGLVSAAKWPTGARLVSPGMELTQTGREVVALVGI